MEYKGYFIFFEREGSSYGAYSPELPGMATVGETLSEVSQFVTEAIDLHIETPLTLKNSESQEKTFLKTGN